MTSLSTASFGDTGYQLTRVGFGCWAIGGGDWARSFGPTDDDVSVAAIHRALELGVNWIDTASVYGLGHSELVVARVLRGVPGPDRPLVFTKIGFDFDEHDHQYPTARVGDEPRLRSQLEGSLRRLEVERVDLLHMHWPAGDTPVEEYWQTLLKFKAEGKAAVVALSNHNVELLDRAEAVAHVSTIQPGLSAINRSAATDVLPWCVAHGTGAIVYSPMQSGLLSGSFTTDTVETLADNDFRRRDAMFQGDALASNVALANALGGVGARHGVSAGVVAIAWTLAFPGVTAAIVGAETPAQVDQWMPAATFTLSDSELDEIALEIERTGAGSGPLRP